MQITEKNLFEKFQKLAKAVKNDFKNKGLVIPVQHKDGTIQIGPYSIKKKDSAYYIADPRGSIIVGPLNLAQTAVLVANDLALGRWPDTTVLTHDQWYGYKDFAEAAAISTAERARKNKDLDRADFSLYKASVAAEQKLYYKKTIDMRFNKLCNLT